MTKRKLWNQLTKMNKGKSKSKNYDVAETLNDLIEVIAGEFALTAGMHSVTLELIEFEADKLSIKMQIEAKKNQGKEISQAMTNYFIEKPKTKRKK